MKKTLLLVIMMGLCGCQAQKTYWYSANKTFAEAKWDLVTSARYTAYGCPSYCQTRTEEGIRSVSRLERNMNLRGYKRVPDSKLPKDANKGTVWLHLVPYRVAGLEYSLPRWPQYGSSPYQNSNSPLYTTEN